MAIIFKSNFDYPITNTGIFSPNGLTFLDNTITSVGNTYGRLEETIDPTSSFPGKYFSSSNTTSGIPDFVNGHYQGTGYQFGPSRLLKFNCGTSNFTSKNYSIVIDFSLDNIGGDCRILDFRNNFIASASDENHQTVTLRTKDPFELRTQPVTSSLIVNGSSVLSNMSVETNRLYRLVFTKEASTSNRISLFSLYQGLPYLVSSNISYSGVSTQYSTTLATGNSFILFPGTVDYSSSPKTTFLTGKIYNLEIYDNAFAPSINPDSNFKYSAYPSVSILPSYIPPYDENNPSTVGDGFPNSYGLMDAGDEIITGNNPTDLRYADINYSLNPTTGYDGKKVSHLGLTTQKSFRIATRASTISLLQSYNIPNETIVPSSINVNGIGPTTGITDNFRVSQKVTVQEFLSFLNSVAFTVDGDTYNIYSGLETQISRQIVSGRYQYGLTSSSKWSYPVYVTYLQAIRYLNWLKNDRLIGQQNAFTTENGLYLISGTTVTPNATIGTNDLRLPTYSEYFKYAHFGRRSPSDYYNLPNGQNSPPIILRNTTKSRSYISNIKNNYTSILNNFPAAVASFTGTHQIRGVTLKGSATNNLSDTASNVGDGVNTLNIKHIDTYSPQTKTGNYGIQLDITNLRLNSTSIAVISLGSSTGYNDDLEKAYILVKNNTGSTLFAGTKSIIGGKISFASGELIAPSGTTSLSILIDYTNNVPPPPSATPTNTPSNTATPPVTPTRTASPTPSVPLCGNNILVDSTFTTGSTAWTYSNVDRYTFSQYTPEIPNVSTEYVVDLNATSPGFISQSFNTIVGQTYTVKFNLSGNLFAVLGGSPRYRTMNVAITNLANNNVVSSQDYTFDTNGLVYNGTMAAQGWQEKSFTFVSPATALSIKLSSTCSTCGSAGPIVDNVTICGQSPITPTPTQTPTVTPSKLVNTSIVVDAKSNIRLNPTTGLNAVNTGIYIDSSLGRSLSITATGIIGSVLSLSVAGPAGLAQFAGVFTNPDGSKVTLNGGSLVGKIGANGNVFFIGSSTTINPSVSGILYLGIFDGDGAYADNSGSFNVIVNYASTNSCIAGEGWVNKLTPISVGKTYISGDGNVLFFIGEGRGQVTNEAYKSSDFGNTWSSIFSPSTAGKHFATSKDGKNLAIATTDGYLYTSSDGGANWTLRSSAGTRNWSSVAISDNGLIIYASEISGNGIYKSGDGGNSWVKTAAPNVPWSKIICSSSGENIFAFAATSAQYTSLSKDGGLTWTVSSVTTALSSTFFNSGVSTRPLAIKDIEMSRDGKILFVSALSSFANGTLILISADFGASWKAHAILPRLGLSLKSSYDGNKVFAGFEGFIYTSSDSGITWNERSSVGVGTWSSLDCSNNGQKAIVGKANSLLFSDCSIPLVTPTQTSTRTPTVSKSQTPTPTRTPGLILQNRSIPVGDGPIDIAINNNTNTLYVLNQNDNNITVLDSFTYSRIATIPVGTNPSGITFNKLTNKIYVANTGNNSVTIIDTASNSVIKTIVLPAASGPKGIVVNPNTNRIFVGNSNSYTVTVIDGNTDSIISTVSRPPSLTGAFAPDKLVLDSQNNTVYFYKSSMSLIGYIDDSISSSPPSTYSWTLLQFNTFAVSLQDIYAYNGSLFVYYLENFGDILCLSKILRSSLISDNSINIINTVLRIDSGGNSLPVSLASTRLIGIAQDTILLYNNNITTSLNQATTGRLLRVPTSFATPSTISLSGIPANGTGVKVVKGNNDVFSDSRLFLLNYDKDILDVVDILTFDTTPTPTPTITQTLTRTPTPTPTRCAYPNSIQNPDFKNVTSGKFDNWDFSSTESSIFPYFDDVPKLVSSTSKSVAQLDSSGSISQAFNTIAGQVYQITFKYSANGSPVPAKQSFSVGFGGNISTTDYAVTPNQGLTLSSFDFSSPVGDVFSYDNDPYINNVSLLLRGNGTSVVDTSNYKNAITNSSNVQLNSSQYITGTQSLYFNGSTNQYLSVPYGEQFNFGSGDFTIETWIKIDTFIQTLTVFGQFFGISLYFDSGGGIGFYYGGTSFTKLTTNNVIKIGKWTHLALTKKSGLIKIYIDGYSSGQAYLPGVIPPGRGDMFVGGYLTSNAFKGYIDDLRVTKGICRYDDNFIPLHQNRTSDESVVKHWKYGKLFVTAPTNSSRISFVNSGTETVLIDDIVVCGVPNFTRTPTPTKTGTPTTTPTKTGTQTPTPTQTPTILVDDSLNIKHFLGIRKDKKLMSWGYNNNGQLGLGDDLSRSVPTLFNIPNWKKIITNPYFSTKSAALAASNSWYGIKTNNTLWEWRELESVNSNILKTTNLESLSYITRDILDFTFKNSTSIYFVDANTRNLYSYDLVSRTRSNKPIIEEEVYSIVSISENYFAVLYNGPTNLLINLEGSDTFLKFNYTEYKKISANSRGTLFAIDNDDYLFGMGSNSFGQLGNNSQRESLFLSKIGNKTWIDVSSGQYHTLGIDTDGFAYAWGRNTDGELGDGTLTSRLVPTKINSAEDGWINIYAGTFYSIAKKYDLTLWAWGRNTENSLGTVDSTIVSSKTPILIPGIWKDIAVYDSSIFALGDTPPTPTPTNSVTPSRTPTQTQTPTKTSTETPTPTKTPTSSITASKTPTPTSSETPTSTVTPTQTPTESPTPTQTPTESVTPTQTRTSSVTPTQTSTLTPTNTPTSSETPTPTSSLTPSKTPTNTPTSSVTPSQTPTMTATPTSSITPTPTETPTNTPTSTSTITPTVTSSQTPTPSITPPLRLFYYYISDSKEDLCSNKEEGNVKTISVYDIDSSLQTTTFLYKDKDASTRWLFDDLNTRLGSSVNRIYMVGITSSSISALVEDIDGYAIIDEQDISC